MVLYPIQYIIILIIFYRDNMDIDTFYKILQDPHLSNDEVLPFVDKFSQYINSYNFSAKNYFNDSYYATSIFAAVVDEKTLEKLAHLPFLHDKPVFFSHCLILAATHNPTLNDEYIKNLSLLLYRQKQDDDQGSTLGYAIGYLIGHCIKNGIDSTDLLKLTSSNFVREQKTFLIGIGAALNLDNKSLVSDSYYQSCLLERYSNWSSESRKASMRALTVQGCLSPEDIIINPINEKMTWFLHNRCFEHKTLTHLHDLHTKEVKRITQEFIALPQSAQAVYNMVQAQKNIEHLESKEHTILNNSNKTINIMEKAKTSTKYQF